MRKKLQAYISRLQREGLDPKVNLAIRSERIRIAGKLQALVNKDITEQIDGLESKLNLTD